MKGNRELDDLLIAYVLKELNAEEEAVVVEYISSNEDNKRHFEELRNTWKAVAIKKGLEKVDVNSEWEHFGQTIALEKQKLIAIKTDVTGAGRGIEEKTDVEERIPERGWVRRRFISLAVAASILAVVVAGWIFWVNKEQDTHKIAVGTAPLKTATVASALKHETNSTGRTRKLTLSDGSEIILADKSEISYHEPFIDQRRDIFLKGKADFKVTQDKARPFTVYSSELATTVLGTYFTVSAFEQEENIIVRLHEGKVVVKSSIEQKTKLGRGYYLLPGQELIYNNRNYSVRLRGFKQRNAGPGDDSEKEAYKDSPDLPENNKGSWYMFNNQSLEEVFNQLKLLYNTDIVYSKREVHNLYFIGKFDKTDSLYTILNQIASLNDLKVSKKNNKFIISK